MHGPALHGHCSSLSPTSKCLFTTNNWRPWDALACFMTSLSHEHALHESISSTPCMGHWPLGLITHFGHRLTYGAQRPFKHVHEKIPWWLYLGFSRLCHKKMQTNKHRDWSRYVSYVVSSTWLSYLTYHFDCAVELCLSLHFYDWVLSLVTLAQSISVSHCTCRVKPWLLSP